jgi:hypothetical protein
MVQFEKQIPNLEPKTYYELGVENALRTSLEPAVFYRPLLYLLHVIYNELDQNLFFELKRAENIFQTKIMI